MGLDLSGVPVDLVIYILNIVILYVILRALVYRPVQRFMQARANRVAGEMDAAVAERAEAENLKAEYRQHMDAAKAEAAESARESIREANGRAEEIVEEARSQAKEIVASAQREVGLEQKNALLHMQDEILDIATQISGRIIQRELDADANRDIADAFFREVV